MPSVYSHYNRNVSSVWYLVVIFIVVVGTATWRAYLAIQDIQRNNEAMVAQMSDVMVQNQPR
jgi:hypothetical protein